MLPNLSNTVRRFRQTITKRTVTQTIVNYEPVNTYTDTQIEATVTTPKEEELNQMNIDASLKYKTIHTTEELKMNDTIIHKGTEYKIIKAQDRQDYGYTRAIAEEVQR